MLQNQTFQASGAGMGMGLNTNSTNEAKAEEYIENYKMLDIRTTVL